MAFCIECGCKLPDNAKFCLECGTAVAVKVNPTANETGATTLKLQFQEQEVPKYKETTETSVNTAAKTVPVSTSEEEYFDDDNSIELFKDDEEKTPSGIMDVDTDLNASEEPAQVFPKVPDETDGSNSDTDMAAQAQKYFEGLSAAQDYAYEQGLNGANITPETISPILNPILDPYFDDVLPEINDEINKADKTLLVKPALIVTLMVLAAIWFIYML